MNIDVRDIPSFSKANNFGGTEDVLLLKNRVEGLEGVDDLFMADVVIRCPRTVSADNGVR